jgi:hypothetical protein
MSLFRSSFDGNSLVGKLCKLSSPNQLPNRSCAEVPDIWDKTLGWSCGSHSVWYKKAEEIIPKPDAQQDSGEDLLGVECYFWDCHFDSKERGIVSRIEGDSIALYPYRKLGDTVYAHARPVALGPLPESEQAASSRFAMIPDRLFGSNPYMVDSDASSSPKPKPKPKPTATWDMVKGQDEAKQALKEAVELPREFTDLYAAYGKKASKGALLYGPPGCGKTLLGRTLAGTLGCGEDGFRYVKGGELFSERVGAEEAKIREIFQAAKQYKQRTGIPQIVFFDEADALFPKRTGKADRGHSYDFMASTIGAFLTELDGLEECGAFVILSTNRPEVMDPAVLRDGRIDRKVLVARPNQEVAGDILRSGLSKAPGFNEAMIPAMLSAIYNTKLCYYIAETEDHGAIRVNFHHQISGALLDGVVERTINEALQRDIQAGNKAPTGITLDDISKAVDGSWRSTLGLDLQWLMEEVVGQKKINSITTVSGRWLGIHKREEMKVKIEHKISDGGDISGED